MIISSTINLEEAGFPLCKQHSHSVLTKIILWGKKLSVINARQASKTSNCTTTKKLKRQKLLRNQTQTSINVQTKITTISGRVCNLQHLTMPKHLKAWLFSLIESFKTGNDRGTT